MNIHWRYVVGKWALPDTIDIKRCDDDADCTAAGTMRYMVRWCKHHDIATEEELQRKGMP